MSTAAETMNAGHNPVEAFITEVKRITSEHCDAGKPDGWPDDDQRKEIGRGLGRLAVAAERWIADTNPEDDGTATQALHTNGHMTAAPLSRNWSTDGPQSWVGNRSDTVWSTAPIAPLSSLKYDTTRP